MAREPLSLPQAVNTRRARFLAAALAGLASLRATETAPLLRDALAAEARHDSRAALELFQRADAARPGDAFIQQKLSRQLSDLTVETADLAEKERLCLGALAHAQQAVELKPDDAVNVLSVAICYGKLATYADTRKKIEYSRLVKEHAERALALNPAYDYAHHVLGRWHYEVASLGATTRFFVRLIYGGLPPAFTAEAVRHLRRAVELAPQLPSHRVELGLALIADGQRELARQTLTQALALPKREKYDDEAWRRAREALAKL